jgi:ABC-2 type transport system ATP-binding protein
MHVLELDHVTKRYGQTVAVDDLSFRVEPGLVTGFLGPNGSGKSTTMKILLDLASADHGWATIGGSRYRELVDPPRTVGVILEPNAFHPARSGRNHLRVLADGAGIPGDRIDEMLRLVGLDDAADRMVGTYSLGMRQRLGLAAAVLGDPPVLVLDEPANGLDPEGIRWLRNLLRSRAANGNTVFVSSHLLAEVEHLADEVVVINHGRLITTGAISDLRRVGTSVRTPSPEQLTAILETADCAVQVRTDGSLLVRGLTTAEIGDRAFAGGISLHELSPHVGSLEDLFLGWTGSEETIAATPAKKEKVLT